ncbi:hypothetical protein CSB09_04580 [Candidatus Gracilibacteria bacterium]|nr:MAG: hypothetical protein CSB09_04580 [Candidatus Gracilibacteria bacterium]
MSTFTDLQKKGIEVGHTFNLLEVGLFETYLMVAGFLMAIIFPSLLEVHTFLYFIVFLFGIIFILKEFITKNKNVEKRWKRKGWNIQLLKNFSFLDFAIYKVTIVAFGLLLVKIFPVLLNGEFVVWYTLVFGIGFGYFIAKITAREKE